MIRMKNHIDTAVMEDITFLIGNPSIIAQISAVPVKEPFHETVIDFLNELSKRIIRDPAAKLFPDLITFAFWIRMGNVVKLKERFELRDGNVYLGRGVVFHVAPSNVPVNFAYSLAAGLLCGNANIVRVPSRDFEQVKILVNMINSTLEKYQDIKPYICLVRYGHEKKINDLLSSMSDVRVLWGGDKTIEELRKSALMPRATEICFADRYSLAVIDSDAYMMIEDKKRVAEDFYNDTYLFDQNACTSPRMVVWIGNSIDRAKNIFWEEEHKIVKRKYQFQPIQGINKLTKSCLLSAALKGCRVEQTTDNLIVRIKVQELSDELINYRENSGFFVEYDCRDIIELVALCKDIRCQTIAYVGNIALISSLVRTGIKGIDRIVPIGRTMDFDLIWDGYLLPYMLTRTIAIVDK